MSQAHDHAHDDHAHDAHHHVTPMIVYWGVFGALLVLTAVTVWIAQFHFGAANTLVAMAVATVKASLVALFFMHLLHDERLNSLAFVFGLIFVALFFIFTLADVYSRGFIDPIQDIHGYEKAQVAELRLEAEKAAPPAAAAAPVDPAAVPADERAAPAPMAAPDAGAPMQGAAADGGAMDEARRPTAAPPGEARPPEERAAPASARAPADKPAEGDAPAEEPADAPAEKPADNE
ncbi:MAG: cytochrome C oxidase subunit IV family protein [Myxococcales bacterium]|nr:cytochrome C oxidase subunit IV family protein [Myxococcales bacterium]